MERTRSWSWRSHVIPIICVVSTLIIPGVQSQTMECFSCTDRGDGGCSAEKVLKVSCSREHNVCIETVTAMQTSHDQFTVVVKGCGYGGSGRLDKGISFHGITTFIQVNLCNSSLCNTKLELEKFQLLPTGNDTRLSNNVQCYSCIGKAPGQCSPSSAPTTHCYNRYESCFDGNATVTIGNATTVIPIRSCSQRHSCPLQTLTYGGATFVIKGACCAGNMCNQDLSNVTQYPEPPPVVLISDPDKKLTTTMSTPHWLTTGHALARSPGPTETHSETDKKVVTPMSSLSGEPRPKEDHPKNVSGLPVPLWLLYLLALFTCACIHSLG
ncbi:ly6/PLAUR domain-containing protein 3-like [Ascaphus truei]|uniref:ly6/PLAUR domain-containing protein 3-like n=1 Tax=Ascaphus truei TaxID=8439 RepID=UPI003F5ABC7C